MTQRGAIQKTKKKGKEKEMLWLHCKRNYCEFVSYTLFRIRIKHPRSCCCRAKEKQRSAMRAMKQQYEPGLWNVGTVTMGGLGGEPGVSEDSEEGWVIPC